VITSLNKYDAVLNEHLKKIVNTREKMHKRESKRRESFVTLLIHYSIDNVVASISSMIKSTISYQMKQSNIFSILIDTTQDISVIYQCSVILWYVINGEIDEKLIAVKFCTDFTEKGMIKLLQSTLLEVDVHITRCIRNAANGAANIQGIYKGFLSWLSKTAPVNKFMFGAIVTF
jgi:hypothetical protein